MEENKKEEAQCVETTNKKEEKKQKGSQKAKVAKGTRDFAPKQMVICNKAFEIITNIIE